MDLKQSIRNQTYVSVTLATHLLSKKNNSNVVFSPLSIHVALSLLAAGSKGQTQDQPLAFLKTNTTDELNSLYSKLVPLIFADGSPRGGPRASFANGVWFDETLSLKPSFKEIVDTVYKAACNKVDFHKAVEVAEEVNLWAEKETNGLIKQVITVDEVKDLTWLIYANAVYFKGIWREKFNASNTKEYDFHLLDGNKVKVPFMRRSYCLQSVGVYDDFKVLALPYLRVRNEAQFTMYFFLPHAKDGLQSLVKKMCSTSDFLDTHISRQKLVEVPQLLIPKFKISFGFEASDMLKDLGLVLPFHTGDALTEMFDSEQGIFVSRILQKSFVVVNEDGTEALAYAMEMMCGSLPNIPVYDKVDFVADHPFLFAIREDVTEVFFFMGQVVDPRL